MSKILYVSTGRQAIDLLAVEDLFTMVGDVASSRIEFISQNGNNRGFGVFEMSTVQQACDCAERFHGQSMSGQVLSVVSSKPADHPVHVVSVTAKSKLAKTKATKAKYTLPKRIS